MFGRIENEFRALCDSDSTSKVFVAAHNRKLESVNGVTDYRTERDPNAMDGRDAATATAACSHRHSVRFPSR